MNKIIALYGHQKCGKTTTLNLVRELIRSNGGISLSSCPPYSGDKPETFCYKNQIVCVCPGGDNGEVIKKNFKYAYSKNADILITASRCKGEAPKIINTEAAKLGISVKWYQKCLEYHLSESTQMLCNKELAKKIFDTL